MNMPMLFPAFIGTWEPLLWRGPVLLTKPEWQKHQWTSMGMSRPSSARASFSDGLQYHLPAFPQAQYIGVELGLLANPTDGS